MVDVGYKEESPQERLKEPFPASSLLGALPLLFRGRYHDAHEGLAFGLEVGDGDVDPVLLRLRVEGRHVLDQADQRFPFDRRNVEERYLPDIALLGLRLEHDPCCTDDSDVEVNDRGRRGGFDCHHGLSLSLLKARVTFALGEP